MGGNAIPELTSCCRRPNRVCSVFAFLAFILRISFVELISLFLKLALAFGECLIHFFSTDNKNFLVL